MNKGNTAEDDKENKRVNGRLLLGIEIWWCEIKRGEQVIEEERIKKKQIEIYSIIFTIGTAVPHSLNIPLKGINAIQHKSIAKGASWPDKWDKIRFIKMDGKDDINFIKF